MNNKQITNPTSGKPLRVFYLLNHKTAAPMEVSLLKKIGFEVYLPKKLSNNYGLSRSGAIFWDLDKDITIPKVDVKKLDSFNFYDDVIPESLFEIINEHFDLVFLISNPDIVQQFVAYFQGITLVRNYHGMGAQRLYSDYYFKNLHYRFKELFFKFKDRIICSPIFDTILEDEDPEIQKMSILLPLGVPDEIFANRGLWQNGKSRDVLFHCPEIMTVASHRDLYDKFKVVFSDFDYKIFGQQRTPVPDRGVLGFISDEEMTNLWTNSALFSYMSEERAHLHYSPVEAMIWGMPVIFNKKGILGRLLGKDAPGGFDTVEEARVQAKRILANDQVFIKSIVDSQNNYLYQQSSAYALKIWVDEFNQKIIPRILSIDKKRVVKDLDYTKQFPKLAYLYDWLNTIVLPGKIGITGRSTGRQTLARIESVVGGAHMQNAKVLECGEGDGALAAELLHIKAASVTSFGLAEADQQKKMRLLKSTFIDGDYKVIETTVFELKTQFRKLLEKNEKFDYVIVHGILNFCVDYADVIRCSYHLAKVSVIFEVWGQSISNSDSKVRITTSSEQSEGMPMFEIPPSAIKDILENEGPFAMKTHPTIGYESARSVVIITK